MSSINNDFPAKYVSIRQKDKKRGMPSPMVPTPKVWFFEDSNPVKTHLNELINQIQFILDYQISEFEQYIKDDENYLFPVIVELQDNKLAKNHRPSEILNKIDSEVIAIHELGKIIISSSKSSLEILIQLILDVLENVPTNRNDWLVMKEGRLVVTKSKETWYELIHQLTCIKQIKLYNADEVKAFMDEESLDNIIKDKEFKVRFFDYGEESINELVMSKFLRTLKEYGINRSKIRKVDYVDSLNIYAIPYTSDEIISLASHFPGIESISDFTYFESVSENTIVEEEIVNISQPSANLNYPKIAVVDSGVSKDNQYLSPWIEDVDNYVVESNQNNYHGNFIAGLINYGHLLNTNLENVVDSGVKILDVIIIPDKNKEKIREDDLIASLEQSLEVYAPEYKVWNLSLASKRVCSGYISEFTAAIDELQERFNVIFVIAAGNVTSRAIDRITSPADSIRGVTVGSIAIDVSNDSHLQKGMRVEYSRKGPGIGLSIKPDVVHYSGNPTKSPIYSVNQDGRKVGDFGTSFSTPLVSAILGEYFHVFPHNMTPLLAKTLLIHSGENPTLGNRINKIETHYEYGYGIPKRITDVLNGNEHEITLIFEGELDPSNGANWIKVDEFPFPDSLYDQTNQKIRGNILVTIGYDTPLDSKYGSEYCRSNLDIRIRTKVDEGDNYDKITKSSNSDGDNEFKWEKDRITKESKWSNIKQVEFVSPRGRKGSNEMILEVLQNWRNVKEKVKIPFYIVLTIKDPKNEVPVYNEVTRKLSASFATNDIRLNDTTIRIDNR